MLFETSQHILQSLKDLVAQEESGTLNWRHQYVVSQKCFSRKSWKSYNRLTNFAKQHLKQKLNSKSHPSET